MLNHTTNIKCLTQVRGQGDLPKMAKRELKIRSQGRRAKAKISDRLGAKYRYL